MAEIAIPVFALGAMYIMSNKNKDETLSDSFKKLNPLQREEGMRVMENFSGYNLDDKEVSLQRAEGEPLYNYSPDKKTERMQQPFVQKPFTNTSDELSSDSTTYREPLPICNSYDTNDNTNKIYEARSGDTISSLLSLEIA